MAPVFTDRGLEKYVHGQVVAELYARGQRRGYCQDMVPEIGFLGTATAWTVAHLPALHKARSAIPQSGDHAACNV